jgi:Tol biopolymer transport system component
MLPPAGKKNSTASRQGLMTGIRQAVFLSYASQDIGAASGICTALHAAGIEAWLDQSELRGGDLWEHEIRAKIRECALFIPIISRHTQERPEGYFRLEWKLAVDRSHLMAAQKAFLVPVVVDTIGDAQALVPDRFREVQWTYLPRGEVTPAFIERIGGLLDRPVAAQGSDLAHEAAGETAAGPLPTSESSGTAAIGGSRASRRLGWLASGAAILLLCGAGLWVAHVAHSWRNPLANAQFSRLTDLSGHEQAAAISRDGRLAAFLTDHDGRTDAWLTRIGSGTYRNLTQGAALELINPEIRTLGFSADGKLVTIWARRSQGFRSGEVNILAEPVAGGPLEPYLPEAAEVAWSSDGRQLVYHTAAPGDPMFVRKPGESSATRIYTAPAGIHCHFQVWSPDDAYIYFARGIPPDVWDIWRIRPSGSDLERITRHNSRVSHPVLLDQRTLLYLATDSDGSGPWLYALDLKELVPHRLSLGLERYTSLAASGDGRRLLATVVVPETSLWSIALTGQEAATSDATRISTEPSAGLSPRLGPGYLLYVSRRGARESIRKLANGVTSELWSSPGALISGAPAIAPDGHRVAFTAAEGARTVLYVMASDGSHVRLVSESLNLRGNPAWAPDGQTIVSAAMTDGEPHLTTIFLDGRPPAPLVSEYSIDPVWSPDGRFLLYSGADLGTTFPVRAVTANGTPYGVQTLVLPRGARRVVFWRDSSAVVVLRGEMGHKDFWLVDLTSGSERRLTSLASAFVIGDFDVSADGSRIVFDRSEDTSQIALIERER